MFLRGGGCGKGASLWHAQVKRLVTRVRTIPKPTSSFTLRRAQSSRRLEPAMTSIAMSAGEHGEHNAAPTFSISREQPGGNQ